MSIFRAATTTNLETLRERLAAAEEAVERAEDRLASEALQAGLSDDPDAGRTALLAKRDALERVELLERAVVEAERLEKERQAKARAELERGRHRALRQHFAAIEKAGLSYAVAVENMFTAWKAMTAAAEKARGVMTGPGEVDLAFQLYPRKLGDLCETEIRRVCLPVHPASAQAGPVPPGVTVPMLFDDPAGVPSLTNALHRLLIDGLYSRIAGGSAPEPAEAVTEPETEAA